jgi:short-subunit dehydrogenase
MNKQYYALITGASRGLGKALAIECARRNMNVVMVALPGEGLTDLASYLMSAYNVSAIAIETDLCAEGGCREVVNKVAALALPVNMLINNAGVGGTGLFSEGCMEHYERLIRLNIIATTTLTRSFVETLKQNAPSHILNVGSLASFFCLARKQVYGATKSYICYFSRSLRRELMREKVFVSVLCPGGMYTNDDASQMLRMGNYIARASGMMPEEVARITMHELIRRKEIILPGLINRSFLLLNSILPRFIVRFLEKKALTELRANRPKVILADANAPHVVSIVPLETNHIAS